MVLQQYNFPGFIKDTVGSIAGIQLQYGDNYQPTDEDMKVDSQYRSNKANMISKLAELADKTKAGDYAFVHFSGHGCRPMRTNYLCLASDIGNTNEKEISDTELYDKFTSKLPAQSHAVLMFDSCHSGRMGNLRYRMLLPDSDKVAGPDITDSWKDHAKTRLWPKAKVISISGSDDGECSYVSKKFKFGSYLTKYFLDTVGFSRSTEQDDVEHHIRMEYPLSSYVKKNYQVTHPTFMNVAQMLTDIRSKLKESKTAQTPQIECSYKIDMATQSLGQFMGPITSFEGYDTEVERREIVTLTAAAPVKRFPNDPEKDFWTYNKTGLFRRNTRVRMVDPVGDSFFGWTYKGECDALQAHVPEPFKFVGHAIKMNEKRTFFYRKTDNNFGWVSGENKFKYGVLEHHPQGADSQIFKFKIYFEDNSDKMYEIDLGSKENLTVFTDKIQFLMNSR